VAEGSGAERNGDAPDSAATRAVGRAGWLSRDVLLLLGEFEGTQAPGVSLHRNGQQLSVESRLFPLPGAGNGLPEGMLVALVPARESSDSSGTLVIATPTASVDVELADLRRASDLRALVLQCLAPLDATTRNDICDFLARTVMAHPGRGREQLGESLFKLRQALRERLPSYRHSRKATRALSLDRLTAIDERCFYLEGWVRDVESEIVRVTAVSPEGQRAEVRERMFQYARPDVSAFFTSIGNEPMARHGFICFIELDAPSSLSQGWVLEMENEHGDVLESGGPKVQRDLLSARDALLADPARDRLPIEELMANHVYPAISRIQKRVEELTRVDTVDQFGDPPGSPDVSMVVPLYQRIDLIEQQLAEFAHDPQLQQADLVYVLDSPEQGIYLLDLASRLYPIYRVPFRVAVLEQNVGFAGANNAGASIAKGRLLLLMNSDVLPDEPGWLGRMRDFYDGTPGIGALGVKLLYEDESIQHAGMYFHRPINTDLWLDAHYFKGLHRDFPAANITRIVPGVSGACMMIDAELYRRLGGLGGNYVQGDYEDFDLCLRLAAEGLDSWYLPDVELYHLEALSYTGNLRVPANRYNMWLHTHLWRERIEALMENHRLPESAAS
jgi:GT2 family glycosyltransferase